MSANEKNVVDIVKYAKPVRYWSKEVAEGKMPHQGSSLKDTKAGDPRGVAEGWHKELSRRDCRKTEVRLS